MADGPHGVGDMLDRLNARAGSLTRITIGDMMQAMGHRGHAPLLILPALLEISPIGGIPGLPTALAAIIVLTAVQIVLGRDHLWLPGFVQRRGIASGRLKKALGKLRPLADRTDRWFHGRLPALTGKPVTRIAAAVVILLACTVPPLELLPFASTAPMAAIIAIGLAMLVRDGALMIAALGLSAAAIGFAGWTLVAG